MKDLTQNPDLRKREKPDDYFGDWKWREGLSELMIPIIGNLYRNGINILIYGQSLVNNSSSEILKAHRFARQVDNNELSELETFPILQRLVTLNLADCEIDIGELTLRCPFFKELRDNPLEKIDEYLNKELCSVIDVESKRPESSKDIVLYGFGRIGRLMARLLVETTGPGNYFRLRAVVVRKGASEDDLLKRASLLRRDSVHGKFSGTIRVDSDSDSLIVNGNPIKFIYASGPESFKYSDFDIDKPIVIDNTGVWRDEAGLSKHLETGADKVVLTAPGKGDIKNIVFGVNEGILDENDQIISAASCTTNAIVPVLKIMNDKYQINSGHIETVHSYTNDQNLIDNYHKGDRRGRSAALNMVITSTGAGKAVTKVIPSLKDKLTANAVRVPTPNGSLAIMNLTVDNETSVDQVNNFLRTAALEGDLINQINYNINEELVSNDIIGNTCCAVFDSNATIVSPDKKNIVLYVWYDNEFGYTKQVIRLAKYVAQVRRLIYY